MFKLEPHCHTVPFSGLGRPVSDFLDSAHKGCGGYD